ncbi:5'-3' exonuclease PLD3-like isoform X1 [Rhopilema esculentum]|uniref:5'-3' exonuclease PLD3-like isoform X1 n=1 Tax=Rhopilema esculentum TaxID=499914 RepID=UPI0031E201CC
MESGNEPAVECISHSNHASTPKDTGDLNLNNVLQSDEIDGKQVESYKADITLRLKKKQRRWTAIVTVTALLFAIFFILLAFLIVARKSAVKVDSNSSNVVCHGACNFELVETIPSGMNYDPGSPKNPAIVEKLKEILTTANQSIDIASSYWTLRGTDVKGGPYPMAKVGEEIFDGLIDAAVKRGVHIRIVHQVLCKGGKCMYSTNDTDTLAKVEGIEVRTLDVEKLIGSGIIHTKLWIVDGHHIYLGSANMDWRSYTEVKELGIMTYNCPCLCSDMSKIFEAYWVLAQKDAKIPKVWPQSYNTNINKENPLVITSSNGSSAVYYASSPPQFCPSNRTVDIDAILHVIMSAKKFIKVAVMDYVTAVIYSRPERYWGVIDSALREAAYDRGVEVQLMMSSWIHTKKEMIPMLKSLQDFGNACKNGSITVKLFTVPAGKIDVPFTRVNHNKYMVTESGAYIGTSNWSGDYFISTAGIGYVISQLASSNASSPPIQEQLRNVFQRDWNSKFASAL